MTEKSKTVSYNFAGPTSHREGEMFTDAIDRAGVTTYSCFYRENHSRVVISKIWEEKADSVFFQLFPNDSL